MIQVFADNRGDKYRLLVLGHADDTPVGRQVCAAVSALTGALVSFAESQADCYHVRYAVDTGKLFLSCNGALSQGFLLITQALHALALEHPKNMQYSCVRH